MAVANSTQIAAAVKSLMASPGFQRTSYGKMTAAQLIAAVTNATDPNLSDLLTLPSGVSPPQPVKTVAQQITQAAGARVIAEAAAQKAAEIAAAQKAYDAKKAADAAAKEAAAQKAAQDAYAAQKAAADKAAADKAAAALKVQQDAAANAAAMDKLAQSKGYANYAAQIQAINAAAAAKTPVAGPVAPTTTTAPVAPVAPVVPKIDPVAEFEKTLPTPDEAVASGKSSLRGPDGSQYTLMPANQLTGTPRQWIKTDENLKGVTNLSTGVTTTVAQNIKDFNAIQAANDQYAKQTAAAKAEQQKIDSVAAAATKAKQEVYNTQLASAKTQSDIDGIVAKAKSEGITLDQGYIDQGVKSVQQQQAQANQQAIQAKQEYYTAQLNGAKTQSDIDAIVAKAKSEGAPINQGYIDLSTKAVQQQQAQIAQQVEQAKQEFTTSQKTGGTFGKLSFDSVINQKDLDASVMNQFGSDINKITQNGKIAMQMSDPNGPGYVSPTQMAYWMRSGDQYRSNLQTSLESAAKLPPPGPNDGNKFVNGIEFSAIQDNPLTKDVNEGGWYVQTPEGIQKVGSDAKLTGPVIPDYKALNTLNADVKTSIAAYQQQQQAEQAALAASTMAKNTKDFEAALPTPDQMIASGKNSLRGPDDSTYSLMPANQATGAPRQWIKTDPNLKSVTYLSTGKTTSVADNIKDFNSIQSANNQVQLAQRAAAAEAAAHKNDFTMNDFMNVLGIVGVAALGVYVIGALGNGALAAETADVAGGMAANGASANEIAATLTAGGVPESTAAEIASTATDMATGAMPASQVAAMASEGGITDEMLAAASSSADPLAALNEAAGWTAPVSDVVAPAFDTSSMIPTVDSAGNAGFFDPLTNSVYNESGQLVSEAAGSTAGEGTQYAMTKSEMDAYLADPYHEGMGASEISPGEYVPRVEVSGGIPETPELTPISPSVDLPPSPIAPGITTDALAAEEAAAAAAAAAAGAAGTEGATAAEIAAETAGAVPPVVPPVEAPFVPPVVPPVDVAPGPVGPPGTPGTPPPPTVAPPVEPVPVEPGPLQPGPGPVDTTPGPVAPPPTATPGTPPPPDVGPPVEISPRPVAPIDVTSPPAPPPVVEPPVAPVEPPPVEPPPVETPVEPTPSGPPSTPGTPPPPDVGPPTGITTELAATQAGFDAATIARWIAGGLIVSSLISPPVPKIPTPTPLGPTQWGNAGRVNLPGLNPGWMVNPPTYYNIPGPVAPRYYWGQHAPQPGPTFNPALYNTLPVAPPPAYGLKTMYDPRTENIPNMLAGVRQAAAVPPYNVPAAPRV